MNVAYSNKELFEIAKENYQTLAFHCVKLQTEGYWAQPQRLLKQTIQEQLDLYLQAMLVMFAIHTGYYEEEQSHFVRAIPDSNLLDVAMDSELTSELATRAEKVLAAPPILLQLFALRDREKHTHLSVMFVDTMLNIIIAMSYLSEQKGAGIVAFLKEYAKQIQAFLNEELQFLTEIDERYIFRKITSPTFKTGYVRDEVEYARMLAKPSVQQQQQNEQQQQVAAASTAPGKKTKRKSKKKNQNQVQSKRKNQTDFAAGTTELVETPTNYSEMSTSVSNTDGIKITSIKDMKTSLLQRDKTIENLYSEKVEVTEPERPVVTREEIVEKPDLTREDTIEKPDLAREEIIEKPDLAREDTIEKPVLTEEEIAEKTAQARLELEQARDAKRAANVQKWMDQLNELVGLDSVKEEMKSLVNLIKVRKMRENYHMPQMDMTYHMVFTGNAGTGKTTVARLVAEIYKELGVLSKGNFVETDRAGLVAGYLGQTAMKVKEVVAQAKGGVLFIDEAYSLSSRDAGDDYGIEAIDTLVKEMEDNRNDLVVIVAGYRKEMERFLKSNTGLISRFNKYIDFPDYSEEQLIDILNMMAKKAGLEIEEGALDGLREYLATMPEEERKDFGNARGIRNVFEKIVTNQANRIVQMDNPGLDELKQIKKEDVKME